MAMYRYKELSADKKKALCLRPKIDFSGVFGMVQPIIDDVKARGDQSIIELTEKFDKVKLSADGVCLPVASLPDPDLPAKIKDAFDLAYSNIRKFHSAQVREPILMETMPGITCRRVCRPIERVGLYVPGGTAVLPSTALMLGIPAQIAKCTTVVLASPPRADGSICPEVLYAAKKCGVTHILKAGGAQAISAMAFGTASCPKVDKICGPGNQFVTAAKMMMQNSGDAMVAIDMPAGPSEQLCIADKSSIMKFMVSDLISQAEHGRDSQVVCVVLEEGFDKDAFRLEMTAQLDALPRAEIAKEAVSKSFVLFCDTQAAAEKT